jgi:hypothetical protein
MALEVQSQISAAHEASIWLRVGICAQEGDLLLTDLAENAIQVSLESALAFAKAIQSEVAVAQETIDDISRRGGS